MERFISAGRVFHPRGILRGGKRSGRRTEGREDSDRGGDEGCQGGQVIYSLSASQGRMANAIPSSLHNLLMNRIALTARLLIIHRPSLPGASENFAQ